MKYISGPLGVAFACMAMLVEGLAVTHAPKNHATGRRCSTTSLISLVNLTRHLMEESLKLFDEFNGHDFMNDSLKFPELQIPNSSTPNKTKVLCSLAFMVEALKENMKVQTELNSNTTSLLSKLNETITHVRNLNFMASECFKVKCPEVPEVPEMPEYTFGKKLWGHTLLKSAKDYLMWLHKILASKTKEVNKKKVYFKIVAPHQYLRGSMYHL